MLTVAVARSCSDDSEIRYVLPVLWMTSCFHIMVPVELSFFLYCRQRSSLLLDMSAETMQRSSALAQGEEGNW